MTEKKTEDTWNTTPLNVKRWRKGEGKWFQLVIADREGNERKMIMQEVKYFRGERSESPF